MVPRRRGSSISPKLRWGLLDCWRMATPIGYKHYRRARPSKDEVLSARYGVWPEDGLCPLCDREMIRGSSSLNEHHLVPKMYGGVETYFIHRVCHSKIHSVFSEKELAREFFTFEKLRDHPEIARFILWVRKQDPEFIDKHVRMRE